MIRKDATTRSGQHMPSHEELIDELRRHALACGKVYSSAELSSTLASSGNRIGAASASLGLPPLGPVPTVVAVPHQPDASSSCVPVLTGVPQQHEDLRVALGLPAMPPSCSAADSASSAGTPIDYGPNRNCMSLEDKVDAYRAQSCRFGRGISTSEIQRALSAAHGDIDAALVASGLPPLPPAAPTGLPPLPPAAPTGLPPFVASNTAEASVTSSRQGQPVYKPAVVRATPCEECCAPCSHACMQISQEVYWGLMALCFFVIFVAGMIGFASKQPNGELGPTAYPALGVMFAALLCMVCLDSQRPKEEKEAMRRDPKYQFLAGVARGVRHGYDRPYYDFEDR